MATLPEQKSGGVAVANAKLEPTLGNEDFALIGNGSRDEPDADRVVAVPFMA